MSETPVLAQATADAGGLDDEALIAAIQQIETDVRAALAHRAVLITEMDNRITALGYRLSGAADTLAVLLAISPRSAEHILDTSLGLTERDLVWAALATGTIDPTKARHILAELADVPDPQRRELETIAIDFAEQHTAHQLKTKLLALTCDHDPDEHLRTHALDRRGVWITGRGHGMADIHAHLSAEQADAFYQALEQLATTPDLADPYEQGADRTATQRRADAITAIVNTTCRFNIHVDVTIDANLLIGEPSTGGADLGRLGPITTTLARHLAWSPDARWRRLVTDPMTGRLIDTCAKTYRVPQRVKRAVQLRDVTCRFPGCTRPAEYTDTDHLIAWPRGKTNTQNLAGECRRHHRIKTHSAWTVRHGPSGPRHELHWTSPLGTTHITTAHNYHRRD